MFKKILVPTDGTALAEQAVTAAIEFSKTSGSRIVALSVAAPHLFHSTELDAAADAAAVEAENRKRAEALLDEVKKKARSSGVPCKTVISQAHIPGEEILDAAERHHCDAIFMATRGRMGVLDTVFNESQTQLVLKKTRIPVLVFPEPESQQQTGKSDPR